MLRGGRLSDPPLSTHALRAAAEASSNVAAVRVTVLLAGLHDPILPSQTPYVLSQHVTDEDCCGGRGGYGVDPPSALQAAAALFAASESVLPVRVIHEKSSGDDQHFTVAEGFGCSSGSTSWLGSDAGGEVGGVVDPPCARHIAAETDRSRLDPCQQ